MAKFVLGKTPEQLEAEEAERQRELEAEIQQRQLERQAKLEALHKKQKQTKIILISVTSAIAAVLLVFGTYNTFFKHDLTIDDIKPEIAAATNSLQFPGESIGNYLHDNCEALIKRYISLDKNNKTIKSIVVDKNSCYISKVVKLNATLAKVYFSVDINVTENDTEVTDPVIIKQLKKAGFNTDSSTIESSGLDSSSNLEINSSSMDSSEANSSINDSSSENKSDSSSVAETTTATDSHEPDSKTTTTSSKTAKTAESKTTTTTKPAKANAEGENDSDTNPSGLDYKLNTEEKSHYYIDSTGKIMQSGKTTTKRYNFYVPIELYSNKDENGKTITAGFRPAAEMTLYSLDTVDQTQFDEITVYSALDCDESTLKDQDTIDKVSVKVDKTLQDLYEGRDTSQDFYNVYKFNTYDARYDGINSIKVYSQNNALGFNTHVQYTITTSQGFKYMLDTWMLIEPSGNSYIIKGFL